jgi:hypothetical protein
LLEFKPTFFSGNWRPIDYCPPISGNKCPIQQDPNLKSTFKKKFQNKSAKRFRFVDFVEKTYFGPQVSRPIMADVNFMAPYLKT